MKVIVASKNPVKVACTKAAFEKMLPDEAFSFEGVYVSSNISNQPLTCEDTLKGAMNRANGAYSAFPDADYWVGIEGGLEKTGEEMQSFAWIVVKSKYLVSKARTATFFLPPKVSDLIEQGMELGDADDVVFGIKDSKQKNGCVGLLTGDLITRTSFYEHAICLALMPYKNPVFFEKKAIAS